MNTRSSSALYSSLGSVIYLHDGLTIVVEKSPSALRNVCILSPGPTADRKTRVAGKGLIF